ncbi:MAG: glycosyltransferase family 2 protein [Desulfobacterales bacterium]|nr:glycosyltransferase family 2 protein [Desulfobacterales bacterium]
MSVYLSIIVPLYNEEESVEKLLAGLLEITEQFDFSYEIIFVDDGSRDNTWSLIEQLKKSTPQLKAIKFRRNYGQTNAMVAGFDHAQGRIIVTMDGDLQNDPSDIPLLLKKIEQGYDVVSGWRKNRKDHFSRVLPSRIANAIISWTSGVRLHDYGCSLKAYRSECIKPLKAYGEMHRFFPALASMTGARVTEVPVKHHPRKYGVSKYGFERIFKVLSDIFAMNLIIRFSSMPLKGFAVSSIPFLLLTLFFGTFAVLAWHYEWTSGKALFFFIATALSGMSVVHLIALGVLGELVVGTSDLSHTRLPEMTKKTIVVNSEDPDSPSEKVNALSPGHLSDSDILR